MSSKQIAAIMPSSSISLRALAWWGLSVCAILLPLVIGLGLIRFNLNASLSSFTPFDSDEVVYWHQIATFRMVGFNGGQYSVDELTAPAAFSHFHTHGFFHPTLFGLIARVTGWTYTTPIILHISLLMIAIGVFIAVTKPSIQKLAWLIFLLATFWQLWMYIPSVMQENVHQAGSLLMACCFYVRLSKRERTPVIVDVIFILLVTLLALLRLTWAFLAIPYFLLLTRQRWAALLSAGLLILFAVIVFFYTGAPYPRNFPSTFLALIAANLPFTDLAYIAAIYFFENLANLVLGNPLMVLARGQIILLITWLSISGLPPAHLPPLFRKAQVSMPLTERRLHIFNLVMIFYLHLQVYTIKAWADYRVMAPHLLFTLLLMIAFKRYRMLVVIIALNLAAAGAFWTEFNQMNAIKFHADLERREAFSRAFNETLIYDAQAPSAWCNTVYVKEFYPELVELPAGIGFSASPHRPMQAPFRSRYVLIPDGDPDAFVPPPTFDPSSLVPLAETPVGTLYLNNDAAC